MDARRFLFVSADAALITDLAWQVHREGHDVKYYIEAGSDREIGDGFVPKTCDWRAEVEWADVIVFDDIWIGSDIGTGAFARELREQGNAVVVFETENRDGIHLEDAKKIDGQWRVAGDNGMPIVVTGMGETMQAARRQAYERINDVVMPNMYYRDDIGERWIAGDGDRLQAWGYLGPR